MDRWKAAELKDIDDIDFAIAILDWRRMKVTPYSPLGVKLAQAIRTLEKLKKGEQDNGTEN
ncbi:MAG: hypothetical protein J6Q59_06850 [Paludibacteraceae bacterium]|nr:hypothetical protein [Paludibacteraceae bacterium]